MTVMLCRNRVANFPKWKIIFDSYGQAQKTAGLRLKNLWRDIENPCDVFFVFDVDDIDKAKTFINAPEAAEAGKTSGVLDGEYRFLE